MDCHEAQELIAPYGDGELVGQERAIVEEHLAGCNQCRSALQAFRQLSGHIRQAGEFEMPIGLEARIGSAIEADRVRSPGGEEGMTSPFDKVLAGLKQRWPLALSHAGALALGGALAVAAIIVPQEERMVSEQMAQSVLTAHVRDLMSEEFPKVASSDSHTVKPWFAGKLDYSPPVLDLKSSGFPLVSGRIDYLRGRPVAGLEYAGGRHKISLYVLPARDASAVQATDESLNGYNVIGWQQAGFNYWAVSDMNASALRKFTQLLRLHLGSLGNAAEPR